MKQQPSNFQQYQQNQLQTQQNLTQKQIQQEVAKAEPINQNQSQKTSFLNKGFGELMAYGRMGLDEIGHTLKAFPDSIPITPEPGALGEPTPQQVFAEQQGKSPMEMYQRDLYTPKQNGPEQELER